jgi:hypothetical protein
MGIALNNGEEELGRYTDDLGVLLSLDCGREGTAAEDGGAAKEVPWFRHQ